MKVTYMKKSTLSLADFLVRTSAQPGAVKVYQEAVAAFGSNSTGLSTKSARVTRSSKTSAPFAVEDWIEFSGRLLRSGMMRNGIVFPLQPLAPLTNATASGSSPIWQTPVADDAVARENGKWNSRGEPKLSAQVLLWPTPTAHNAKEGAYPAEYTRNTPTLSARAGGRLNPRWVEWLMGFPDNHTDLSS